MEETQNSKRIRNRKPLTYDLGFEHLPAGKQGFWIT